MAAYQPAPTFAEVVLIDERTKQPKFNPIWLNWFLGLVQIIDEAGGLAIAHNSTTGLQGGGALERYHTTQAQNTLITAIGALGTGLLAITGVGTAAARTITGTANQIAVADGGGIAAAPGLSLTIGDLLTTTWTPTLTNVANLDGSTAFLSTYLRAGSFIACFGKVSVDPTAPAVATQLGISLPIASNFANDFECGGVAFASAIAGQGAAILADAANNRAEMQWVAADVTNQPMWFAFGYRIIP